MRKYTIIYHEEDAAEFKERGELWPKHVWATSLYGARMKFKEASTAPRLVSVELPIDKESLARNILFSTRSGHSFYIVFRRPAKRISWSDEVVHVFARARVVHPVVGFAVSIWRKLCKK